MRRGHGLFPRPTLPLLCRYRAYGMSMTTPRKTGVYVGSLDAPTTKYVVATPFRAAYARGSGVYAVRSRPDGAAVQRTRLELTGEPSLVAEPSTGDRQPATYSFSASATALAVVDQSVVNTQVTWFDRAGHSGPAIGHRPSKIMRPPQFVTRRPSCGDRTLGRRAAGHLDHGCG